MQDIIMLRKRSSKESFMSEQPPLPQSSSFTSNYIPRGASLFSSPRHFVSFSHRNSSENQSSVRENHPWDSENSGAVGLGIVNALDDNSINKKPSKQSSRMVLLGSQLRIQIPCIQSSSCPSSPIEFGIKTTNSQLSMLSPMRRSSAGSGNFSTELVASSPRIITGQLPESDIELSRTEDYTCVITHGPNPRTMHIFDCCSVEDGSHNDQSRCQTNHLISFCATCNKKLPQEVVSFYSCDKAFCSSKCQWQEMLYEEGEEKYI